VITSGNNDTSKSTSRKVLETALSHLNFSCLLYPGPPEIPAKSTLLLCSLFFFFEPANKFSGLLLRNRTFAIYVLHNYDLDMAQFRFTNRTFCDLYITTFVIYLLYLGFTNRTFVIYILHSRFIDRIFVIYISHLRFTNRTFVIYISQFPFINRIFVIYRSYSRFRNRSFVISFINHTFASLRFLYHTFELRTRVAIYKFQ